MGNIQSELINNTMSTLTSYASAAARDSAAPAASNTGLCIFRSDTNAIEVSDGTNYQTYNSDGVFVVGTKTNNFSGFFDGTNDAVGCGGVTTLSGQTSFTISTWFNLDSSTSYAATRIFLSGGTSATNRMWMATPTSTTIRYGMGGGFDDFTVPEMSQGTWYHVAVAHSGTSATLYLNGSSISTATVNNPTSSCGSNFKIGSYYDAGNKWFGLLDEPAIWSSALDANNIADIYNSGAAINLLANTGDYNSKDDLTHWWTFGEHASDTGSGGVANGNVITNVENAANPGTNDGNTITGAPEFNSSTPS